MKWNHYLAAFFSGFCFINAIPHLIHGISGQSFPTPFADPPFKGLSSPVINTIWALTNLILGYVLLRAGNVSGERKWTIVWFFLGAAAISLSMAVLAPGMLQVK